MTAKGLVNLHRITRIIPLHEQSLFGGLSAPERRTLYEVLGKLIDDAVAAGENQ